MSQFNIRIRPEARAMFDAIMEHEAGSSELGHRMSMGDVIEQCIKLKYDTLQKRGIQLRMRRTK